MEMAELRAERELERGLTEAFRPLLDAFPAGEVRCVSEKTDGQMTIDLRKPDGTDEVWLFQFAIGAQLEIVRLA